MFMSRFRRNQRGQTLVIFALGATVLVGLAGLAIEGGMLEADRRFDQDISDGAALAGSHVLPTSASAIDRAAQYAVDALWGGHNNVPAAGCALGTLEVDSPTAPGPALTPAGCDPSSGHNLQIHTPYNGHKDQILVRVTHTSNLNLAAVVGFTSASTASRSVAKAFTSGTPFNYAVYAGGNMITNGSADTVANGDVYVRGCIAYNNGGTLFVSPSLDGPPASQAGTVEVYGDSTVIPKTAVMPQVWTSGSGRGNCAANVQGVVTGSPNGQWGASGHASAATENCAPNTVFKGSCPVGEPPVPFVGFPQFTNQDTTGSGGQPCDAPGVVPVILPVTPPVFMTGGCFSACDAGGGSLTFPSGTSFAPGTYAFEGDGTSGCAVIFSGDASNTTTGGDGSGGVTFVLYNGAWMCASTCGSSNGNGNVTFNAPKVGSFANMLVFSCFTGGCGSGSGTIDIEGAHWNVNLIGTIYNPLGDCIIHSNSGQQVRGQLICNNVTLQGGSVSLGSGINWSANSVGTPTFLSQLIE